MDSRRRSDRRFFFGCSDARIKWETTRRRCCAYGGRSAARPSRKPCREATNQWLYRQ